MTMMHIYYTVRRNYYRYMHLSFSVYTHAHTRTNTHPRAHSHTSNNKKQAYERHFVLNKCNSEEKYKLYHTLLKQNSYITNVDQRRFVPVASLPTFIPRSVSNCVYNRAVY